jgi:transcriptional regulator with XRE-family HTH domain
MVERILKLIETKTYGNEADFALKIGIKQQTLNNYTNGKRPVKLDTVLAILHTYSDVSAEWLLRGKGEMVLSDNLPPILGDESENDLDTHAKLAQARKEIDILYQEIAVLKEKNIKQAGCIEWQKDFISELIAEKTELEKKLPEESKKGIV